MKKPIRAVQQFLFRTLNPTGWHVEQLTKQLSPEQMQLLNDLKLRASEYWKVYRSKGGFEHLTNTEPIFLATVAVGKAVAAAAQAKIPTEVIHHHTPGNLQRGFLPLMTAKT